MTITRTPIIERLAARLKETPGGCWEWQGHVMPNGYGTIPKPGHANGNYLVHRVAYQEWIGTIPDGLVVDHLCRNRRCANPDHLEAVTHRENLMRGHGETSRNAKKTHCDHGHEFTVANTKLRDGWRFCRACDARRAREYRARKKAAQTTRL